MSTLTLSRELRFGVSDIEAASPNGFAGHPALVGVAPFLKLTARLRGAVDPATGMLVNIKIVDRLLRHSAVAAIADYHQRGAGGGADLMLHLLGSLRQSLQPHQLVGLQLALSPYLTLAIFSEDPSVVELSQRFEFAAAHRLYAQTLSVSENLEAFGRCTNPNGHGHNYEVEVTVAGKPDSAGCVLPVPQLQKIVNERVIDPFDHKHLNLDCAEFATLNPTVENIAQVIFQKLQPAFSPAVLKRVRVWETPKTYAEVSA